MTSSPMDGVVLALDVGLARIGVARCRLDVRLPQPLTVLDYDAQTVVADIRKLVREESASMLAVGWPRGMDGQSTQQTEFVEALVADLRPALDVPVYLQDEALTSQRAEAELQARKKPFTKGDIDALAATYILEDFLQSEVFRHAVATEAGHV